LSLAVTTFVGQNLGAGKVKRAKKGANVALVMALITTVSIMIPMLLFAPHLVRFFNKEEMPIHYGAILLRLMSPFYLFCCVNQTYSGALRGAGKASAPMIIMLSCFVGFRQLYLALTFRFENFILTSLAYPAGWALCATIMFTYYRLSKWKVNVISKEEISDKSE
jgi:Na+-driven multidrug efflux pump